MTGKLGVTDLTRQEGIDLLESGVSYPVWTPLDAFDAARSLQQMLGHHTRLLRRADLTGTVTNCKTKAEDTCHVGLASILYKGREGGELKAATAEK